MARHIPIDRILEVANKAREAANSASEGLRVCVLVDERTPRWLAETVRDALVPQMGATTVDVRGLVGFGSPLEGTDLAIVLSGGSEGPVAAGLKAYAAGVPCAVCAETSLEIPEGVLDDALASSVQEVVGSEPDSLLEKLCAWMLDAADPVAVAANFEFCRATETERLIQRCAIGNAAVGTVNILHGADLPIMAANQAKLALDLAAVHGEGFGPMRVAEVAAVAGAGVAYRGVARMLCERMGPLSFLVRGAVGYAGSLATGTALAARFGEMPGVASYVLGLLEEALGGLRPPVGDASPSDTAVMPRAVLDSAQLANEGKTGESPSEDDGYIVLESGGEPA